MDRKDVKQAVQCLEKEAEEGCTDAAYASGVIQRKGEGTQSDQEKVLYWYEKATKGDAEARYLCGMAYLRGEGTCQDEKKAFYWLEKAAHQGHAEAQFQCGFMYRDGVGVRGSQKMAVEWFRECAMQDHGKGQYFLGIQYYFGDRGMPKDLSRGAFWLFQAAGNGCDSKVSRQARSKILWEYRYGNMTESAEAKRDKGELYRLRVRYALAGKAASQHGYGTMFYQGNGVKQDQGKAFYWYEKAAGQGYAPAQCACAAMYREGKGTEKDLKRALFLYEKAAEQGYGQGQYALGCMYEEGEGVSVDLGKAYSWYRKAAVLEHENAKAKLDWLEFRGRNREKVSSIRMVLCDADKTIREQAVQYLQAQGIQKIHEARDSAEALEKYGALKPELVIMELAFPGMAGEEALGNVTEQWPDAKIVLWYGDGAQEQHMAHLVQKYSPVTVRELSKPFTKQDMLQVLVEVFCSQDGSEG